jgi:hypothetical protein
MLRGTRLNLHSARLMEFVYLLIKSISLFMAPQKLSKRRQSRSEESKSTTSSSGSLFINLQSQAKFEL